MTTVFFLEQELIDDGWVGAVAYDNALTEVIEAISSGQIQGLDNLITDRIEMEEIVKKGYLTLLNQGDEHGKSLASLVINTDWQDRSQDSRKAMRATTTWAHSRTIIRRYRDQRQYAYTDYRERNKAGVSGKFTSRKRCWDRRGYCSNRHYSYNQEIDGEEAKVVEY